MNKCHSPIGWHNDTTPALNETNLNYWDGCIGTLDDRVVAMDSSKLESEDIESVIKNVTFSDSTGIFTFTKWDDSTFTVDTKLEKVVTNWTYDSASQSLVLTLADGSTVTVPLSDFITETEFNDSATIAFTVANHVVTATIKANSIGDAQMQTGYLTDCQSAASTASTAATNANTSKLESEGWAVGKQNGVDVGSSSPYYHNNAKYYAQRAGGTSLVGLTDVSIVNPTNGQALVYNNTTHKWVNGNNIIVKSNVSVATSAWTSDSTYADFGYKADISFSGCSADYFADVVFAPSEAMSGKFAPICATGTNKVTIYASEVPSASITIPTIKIGKAVSA